MSIKSQIEGLSRKLDAIKSIEVPRAISYVLNETARKGKTQITKAVKEETGVAASVIKNRFYNSNSTAKKLKSKVTVYRRDIPAISLGVAQTRLRIKKGRIIGGGSIKVGNKTFKNTFVNQTGKNRKWHVLRRLSSKRYPIEVVKVDMVSAINKHAKRVMFGVYSADFEKNLIGELNHRVQKYAKS